MCERESERERERRDREREGGREGKRREKEREKTEYMCMQIVYVGVVWQCMCVNRSPSGETACLN